MNSGAPRVEENEPYLENLTQELNDFADSGEAGFIEFPEKWHDEDDHVLVAGHLNHFVYGTAMVARVRGERFRAEVSSNVRLVRMEGLGYPLQHDHLVIRLAGGVQYVFSLPSGRGVSRHALLCESYLPRL